MTVNPGYPSGASFKPRPPAWSQRSDHTEYDIKFHFVRKYRALRHFGGAVSGEEIFLRRANHSSIGISDNKPMTRETS